MKLISSGSKPKIKKKKKAKLRKVVDNTKPKSSTRLTVKGMTKMLEKIMLVGAFLEVQLPIPDSLK